MHSECSMGCFMQGGRPHMTVVLPQCTHTMMHITADQNGEGIRLQKAGPVGSKGSIGESARTLYASPVGYTRLHVKVSGLLIILLSTWSVWFEKQI